MRQVSEKNWRNGKIRLCEISSIRFPLTPGGPFVFYLTPRGAKEYDRRERENALKCARIKQQSDRKNVVAEKSLLRLCERMPAQSLS